MYQWISLDTCALPFCKLPIKMHHSDTYMYKTGFCFNRVLRECYILQMFIGHEGSMYLNQSIVYIYNTFFVVVVLGLSSHLCSALMVIEQWWFFSVPHLLWYAAYVYNGHLRGPMTHTCCRAFSSGAVTTCFYDSGLSRLGFKHPTFRLRGQRSNPLRHRRGKKIQLHLLINIY